MKAWFRRWWWVLLVALAMIGGLIGFTLWVIAQAKQSPDYRCVITSDAQHTVKRCDSAHDGFTSCELLDGGTLVLRDSYVIKPGACSNEPPPPLGD